MNKGKGSKGKSTGGQKLFHGQLPNEANDVYVRRVYTRKPDEGEDDYFLRIVSRSSNETEENYKARIALIQDVFDELPLEERVIYDEHAKIYIYIHSNTLPSGKQGHPGQLQNESDEDYLRRMYSRRSGESDKDYYMRITSKYSNETTESYKARVELMFKVFKDIEQESIKWDDDKKMYLYLQKSVFGQKGAAGPKGFPGQLANEPDETYIRRVYTKKEEETEEKYILRLTARYGSETDERYKARIELIISIFTEINIRENIRYDEQKGLYNYVRRTTKQVEQAKDGKKLYPNQLPNESDEDYVRRVYTKKTDETEEKYIMRVASRYSSETDEVYKSRIQLIITIIREVNIQQYLRYDETKKMYVYLKSGKKPGDGTTKYPGQQPNESDEDYVRRVYTKKTDETEEKYIIRLASRYSSETDEVYKSRIQLIITIIKEINIQQYLRYDETKKMYVYLKTVKKPGDAGSPDDGTTQPYEGQEPDEPDDEYVRRLYTKKTEESDEKYITRIISRKTTETDEVYKSRIQLIITVIKEINIKEYIKYDEKKRVYVYVKPSKSQTNTSTSKQTKTVTETTETQISTKLHQGQKPNEPNEDYVRRVYSRKTHESDQVYYARILKRHVSETDEDYKSRIVLIITVLEDVQLKQNIVYDETSRQYVYKRPSDSGFSSSTTTTYQSVTTETKQFSTNAKLFPGQKPKESRENYVRRLYSKEADETDKEYNARITNRIANETDDDYKERVSTIVSTLQVLPGNTTVVYDDDSGRFVGRRQSQCRTTVETTVTTSSSTQIRTNSKPFQGQKPKETDEEYVVRVYSRKFLEDNDEDYCKRILTRYGTETDEVYKTRIALILRVLNLNIADSITYDDKLRKYVLVKAVKMDTRYEATKTVTKQTTETTKENTTSNIKGYPGQQPNESDEAYVRRVYSKKTEETEETYIIRVTTRYSTETDEVYKSRIQLIIRVIKEINIQQYIRYDDKKKLYIYVKDANKKPGDTTPGGKTKYPGQQPNESDEDYVRRVYTKKSDETEDKYIMRVTSRYSTETDEVYKSRIQLIITIIKEINIQKYIRYDEKKKLYVYVKSGKTTEGKLGGYPNQLPDESDVDYVRRVYTKKTDETEDKYIMRVTSRYSTETDEVYKSRIQLIITTITEINIQQYIIYDDKKKLYVYVKSGKTPGDASPTPTKYPGQLPDETDVVYVRRVYTKKTDETDEQYYLRLTSRYSNETDEIYKSRIDLIVNTFSDTPIKDHIKYDQKKKLYAYITPSKTPGKKDVPKGQKPETKDVIPEKGKGKPGDKQSPVDLKEGEFTPEKPKDKPESKKNEPFEIPETKEAKPDKTKGKPNQKKGEPTKPNEKPETKLAKEDIPENAEGKPEKKKKETTKENEAPETKEAIPENVKGKKRGSVKKNKTPETKEAKDITPEEFEAIPDKKGKGKHDKKKGKRFEPETKEISPESIKDTEAPETEEAKDVVPDSKKSKPEAKKHEPTETVSKEGKDVVPEPAQIQPESKVQASKPEEAPIVKETKEVVPETVPSQPEGKVQASKPEETPKTKDARDVIPETGKSLPEGTAQPSKPEEAPKTKDARDIIPETGKSLPESTAQPSKPEEAPKTKEAKDVLPESVSRPESDKPQPSKPEETPKTKAALETPVSKDSGVVAPDSLKTAPIDEIPVTVETIPTHISEWPVKKDAKELIPETERTTPEAKKTTADNQKIPETKETVPEIKSVPDTNVPAESTPSGTVPSETSFAPVNQTPEDAKTKLYPDQRPNEPDDVYVRRVYTKKTEETEEQYYLRITTRYTTETVEVYRSRVELIFNIFRELNINKRVTYDDKKQMYVYVLPSKPDDAPAQQLPDEVSPTVAKGYPGQLPDEPNDAYVRRVYTRKTEDTEETYVQRVTTRHSTETDEVYKSRIQLIITIITEIRHLIVYDEVKRIYVYKKPAKTPESTPAKVYPNQLPDETDEDYVRRVYTKKTDETEDKYIMRVTSRYSTETDEVYKSRIQLIITTIKEINIQQYIRYDENKKLYVYVKSGKVTEDKTGKHPGQLANEPDDVYVRRVYTKKPDEPLEQYLQRVTTRYSTETDEDYTKRIELIVQTFTEVNILQNIRYDEVKKLYLYIRGPKEDKSSPTPETSSGKLPNEPDDVYVRRVYTKKPDEPFEQYLRRVTTRYSTETDETYIQRVELVIQTFTELNIRQNIRYDKDKKLYLYVRGPKEDAPVPVTKEAYPGQLPNEPNETYVRRVYTRKTEETEETYVQRVTTRHSTETDEVYKSRIQLIITIITEIRHLIVYDESRRIYVYKKPAVTESPVSTPAKGYPGQLPDEPNDAYVRRVYTRKTEETEETYVQRVTTRHSTETDEVYKSRIQLIITIITEIRHLIVYDETRRIYVYKKPAQTPESTPAKGYPGQLPGEPDDAFVRRVYTRKTEETEETYVQRVTTRQSTETDEVYKSRIQLIITIITEIRHLIVYDETRRIYVYKKPAQTLESTPSKGYPGQLPGEPDDTYVRRVYTRKTEETEETYVQRVTTRHSTETDEVYRSRIQLIITIITEIRHLIVYDEVKRIYVYRKPAVTSSKGYPNQLPDESDVDYVRRVYTKKTDETEDKYIMRVTSRYSTETDELYKSRIQLIITIIKEINIQQYIRYDEKKKLYVYVKSGKTTEGKPGGYPNQLPDESDVDYVRRVYTKKTDETEDKYIMRVTSRYSTETDELYKSRIQLIITIIKEINIQQYIRYDEKKKLYIYVKSGKTTEGKPGGYPNQLPDESDEAYVRRVYTKKSDETEDKYIMRVTSRYSSETDELYKSRIQLIITIITEVNIRQYIRYDENKKLYVFVKPAKLTEGKHGPYQGQKQKESDEEYVRRVYARKFMEDKDEDYYKRILTRYGTETDEVYKSRIALILRVLNIPIADCITYDEKLRKYVLVKGKKMDTTQGTKRGYPGQQPDESDDAYVRRVYTKKTDETEEKYIMRVTSRYSTETDEVYKSRIQLIVTIFSELKIMEHIRYDESKKLYIYRRTGTAAGDPKLYHCQEPGESDDAYVRRVYTQGSNETERDYYLRLTSRSSTETDEKYKARIALIQSVLKDLPLKDKIIYDDHAKMYIYVQSTKQSGAKRGGSSSSKHPGQQDNESNEAYARRVYARKPNESEKDYYLRFTSRYSSETNDSYKARIDIIVNTFKDQNLLDNMSYDDASGLYIYMQPL